jgi:hypothetical protein
MPGRLASDPTGKVASPEEIAVFVAFLLSGGMSPIEPGPGVESEIADDRRLDLHQLVMP